MSQPEIYWRGQSGRKYGYWIYPITAKFRKIAGNTIFTKQTEEGEWIPLYIGQIRNFDDGLAVPDKAACAQKAGATHVHVHFSSPDRPVRNAEVADLVSRWRPICND
jgi:hypothetical protein